MSGQTPAYARTASPITAGPVIVAVAKALGLDLTVDQAIALVPIVSMGYYVIVRALEFKFPIVGYALGVPKQPVYEAPISDEASGEQ